jgi:hypothetical protein
LIVPNLIEIVHGPELRGGKAKEDTNTSQRKKEKCGERQRKETDESRIAAE